MTAKSPKRGAILGYVISMIAMTLGIVVLPVVMAPAASAAPLGDNPLGHNDSLFSPEAGIVRAGGWAFDPNNPTIPLEIRVYVAGVGGQVFNTGASRPDVQAVYPQASGQTGYNIDVPAPGGNDHITVYAINQGPGRTTVLWDGYFNVADPNPIGYLDLVSGTNPGMLRVTGWAFDNNDPLAPLDIHVYVNGVGYASSTGLGRLDVRVAYPQAGVWTGFDTTVPAPGGRDHVTVYAINKGPGDNTVLWDGYIDINTPSPIGFLDSVVATGLGHGQVRVSGWAFDPTSPTTAINVHVYVNNVGYALTVGEYRPDVQSAYPQTTANQGFAATLPAPPGLDQVCAYGINVGPGDNALLPNCVSVTVG